MDLSEYVCYEHGDIAARCCPVKTTNKLAAKRRAFYKKFGKFDSQVPWDNAGYWQEECEHCGFIRGSEEHIRHKKRTATNIEPGDDGIYQSPF